MYCLIVKHGDLERYDMLYKAFGEKMPVVWERRHVERRKSESRLNSGDRRHGERRGPPSPCWVALGFVVVNRTESRASTSQ